jgi:trigger factor
MTTETTERPNKVEIMDAGPSRKKLKIEVPKETVDENLALSMEMLTSDAELPGFRKGHVPRRLLEKKFGSSVRKQAKEQLVSAAFSKALEESKLRVVGQPTASEFDKIEVVSGKPLIFEIEVEVSPEFTMPEISGIPVKKPTTNVSDEMVQSELDKLLVQEGTLEDRDTAEAGDYLTGHAKVVGPDGKVYFEQDGIVVQSPPADKKGKGMIVGLSLDDLSSQLGSAKPGLTITVKAKGPENYEFEQLRGQPITIEYKPARIDRIVTAKLEDVIARFGFADEAALRDAMKKRLSQRVAVEQQAAMRQQVAKHLMDAADMELPERLTASQAARNLERRRLELMYRGMEPLKIEESVAELRGSSNDDAVRELKLFFVLERAAEELQVRVTEGEVNARINQMANDRGERPDKLRQSLINSNQINGVFQQIREHKTLDAILAKAAVTEVDAEEFKKEAEKASKEKDSAAAKPAKKAAPKADADAGDDAPAAKSKSKKKS